VTRNQRLLPSTYTTLSKGRERAAVSGAQGEDHECDVPERNSGLRSARSTLLQREVALRREMEAVAAELRALPPGGEVPEDYVCDCFGVDEAPAKVRLSELFRGRDTLLLYHYMFPRHAEDRRPGPTAGPWPGCRSPRARALRAPR
jgi:predicted dithiol-disulfide oxidoreductase (DUF899 family)